MGLLLTDLFSSVLFFLSTALLELIVELPLVFIFNSVDVSASKIFIKNYIELKSEIYFLFFFTYIAI